MPQSLWAPGETWARCFTALCPAAPASSPEVLGLQRLARSYPNIKWFWAAINFIWDCASTPAHPTGCWDGGCSSIPPQQSRVPSLGGI